MCVCVYRIYIRESEFLSRERFFSLVGEKLRESKRKATITVTKQWQWVLCTSNAHPINIIATMIINNFYYMHICVYIYINIFYIYIYIIYRKKEKEKERLRANNMFKKHWCFRFSSYTQSSFLRLYVRTVISHWNKKKKIENAHTYVQAHTHVYIHTYVLIHTTCT